MEPALTPAIVVLTCVSPVLLLGAFLGLAWALDAVDRALRRRERARWSALTHALGFEAVEGSALCGRRDGVQVEVSRDAWRRERDRSFAWRRLVSLTSIEVEIEPPLPLTIAVLDVRSHRPIEMVGVELEGRRNPMPEVWHRLGCDDGGLELARQIATWRDTYSAFEKEGWRLSFDAARVRLERDGSIATSAQLEQGIASAIRFVGRLREATLRRSEGPQR